MHGTDLQALVAEVEEAREILARKEELARENAAAEKRRDKVLAEVAAAEADVVRLTAEAQRVRDHHEHERNRLAIDLHEHRQQCEDTKQADEKAMDDMRRQRNADVEAFRDRLAGEKRALEAQVAGLQATRDALKKEIQDFRARIQLLG